MKYRGICYPHLRCTFFQPLLGQVLLVPLVYFLLDPCAPCAPPWAGARCSLGSFGSLGRCKERRDAAVAPKGPLGGVFTEGGAS